MPITNLKPVFYCVGQGVEVFSGWINPKTWDVFTTKADDNNAIEVVPRARPAFQTGERVEFTSVVELYPAEDILPNERGNVASWDIETGAISVFLEGVHDGLEGNTLVLVPFHDDWILSVLKRFKVDNGYAVVVGGRWRAVTAFALGMVASAAPWLYAHADTVTTLTDFFY